MSKVEQVREFQQQRCNLQRKNKTNCMRVNKVILNYKTDIKISDWLVKSVRQRVKNINDF